eukprot:gene3920-13993_t
MEPFENMQAAYQNVFVAISGTDSLSKEGFLAAMHELFQEYEILKGRKDMAEARNVRMLVDIVRIHHVRMLMDIVRIHHVSSETPLEFLCPLSGAVMKHPVVLWETGASYEKAAMENWYAKGNRFCPRSGIKFRKLNIVPNLNLKEAIERWRLYSNLSLSFRPIMASLIDLDKKAKEEANKATEVGQELTDAAQLNTTAAGTSGTSVDGAGAEVAGGAGVEGAGVDGVEGATITQAPSLSTAATSEITQLDPAESQPPQPPANGVSAPFLEVQQPAVQLQYNVPAPAQASQRDDSVLSTATVATPTSIPHTSPHAPPLDSDFQPFGAPSTTFPPPSTTFPPPSTTFPASESHPGQMPPPPAGGSLDAAARDETTTPWVEKLSSGHNVAEEGSFEEIAMDCEGGESSRPMDHEGLGVEAGPLGMEAVPLGMEAAPLGTEAAPLGMEAAPSDQYSLQNVSSQDWGVHESAELPPSEALPNTTCDDATSAGTALFGREPLVPGEPGAAVHQFGGDPLALDDLSEGTQPFGGVPLGSDGSGEADLQFGGMQLVPVESGAAAHQFGGDLLAVDYLGEGAQPFGGVPLGSDGSGEADLQFGAEPLVPVESGAAALQFGGDPLAVDDLGAGAQPFGGVPLGFEGSGEAELQFGAEPLVPVESGVGVNQFGGEPVGSEASGDADLQFGTEPLVPVQPDAGVTQFGGELAGSEGSGEANLQFGGTPLGTVEPDAQQKMDWGAFGEPSAGGLGTMGSTGSDGLFGGLNLEDAPL